MIKTFQYDYSKVPRVPKLLHTVLFDTRNPTKIIDDGITSIECDNNVIHPFKQVIDAKINFYEIKGESLDWHQDTHKDDDLYTLVSIIEVSDNLKGANLEIFQNNKFRLKNIVHNSVLFKSTSPHRVTELYDGYRLSLVVKGYL